MSTAGLSIIIPVYREPLELPRLLADLATCPRIRECEIIVVDGDGGSSLCPTTILPLRVLGSESGRGRQLNAGAGCATAPRLLFLHVDTRLPRRFVSLIEAALAQAPAGAFDLSIQSNNPIVRLISATGMVRSRLTRIPYGDQAHFFRTDVFGGVGGYPEIPIMEDVAIMDRLKREGAPIRFIGAPAATSDRRWRHSGAVRNTLRNWRLMSAFRAGVSPFSLKHRYPAQAAIEERREAIIVFYRGLRPDGVKTRLARGVGVNRALELYAACVRDLQAELTQAPARVVAFIDEQRVGIDLFARSRVPKKLRSRLLPEPGGTPQIGNSLWERMDDAFQRCFAAGVERVILVGSDVPLLRVGTLARAISALRRHDTVLGPTSDGGFYLIGFTEESYQTEALFAGAYANEGSVARATLTAFDRAGLRTATMLELGDLDTAADLQELEKSSKRAGRHLRRAMRRAAGS